jgi:hypothetical protein
MNEQDESTAQTLRTLAFVMRGGDSGKYEVRITPEFLESVADELDGVNSLKIYAANGDLVCTIDEPLASSVMNSAVKHYVERALREALESPNS